MNNVFFFFCHLHFGQVSSFFVLFFGKREEEEEEEGNEF